MALPTDPTATTLTTEAYKASGIASPSAAQLTRATDEWLQEILDDIWNTASESGNTRLKTLQETLIAVSTSGKRFYDLGEDVDEELVVDILDGSRRGTAQSGAAGTITLASADGGTVANTEGKYILITGGTGSAGYKECISFNATTKVATMDSNWDTAPDATSTYLVVDNEGPNLDEEHISEVDDVSSSPLKGKPTTFCKYNRQIIFNKPFDKSTYGLRMRYYMNIHQVNLTGGATTRITRIYRNWHDVLKQGLIWKCLRDLDDNRYQAEFALYEKKKANLIVREIAYGGEFTQIIL